MLMGKKTQKTKNPQRKKVLCRFFKPVLSMAPKQDPSLLGSNCQLTPDLSQNVGSMLPMAVNLLSHCISAMLRDAFSSPSNHSRIPQESAVGVSGLQVPLILFICSRDLKVPVLYSQQKKKCSNTCWRHSRNYCCAEEACGVWQKKIDKRRNKGKPKEEYRRRKELLWAPAHPSSSPLPERCCNGSCLLSTASAGLRSCVGLSAAYLDSLWQAQGQLTATCRYSPSSLSE